ncbi:ATP-binding protein [Marinospirillum alkaliphilum]|uniref:histidine kinase n=1 Tax=Marinospirillum alkaliphilum DSM 21637 TaxID=1122209 RepID=A0A1K1ZST3_9GAMM|nr:ATP-binding protein [Marinospirillum alkaliphilum]SFX77246.1 two-component system, OmpR family, sensor histidine kinase RstB [Marinospirillum alkaliphilum DSM 21637]
MSLALLQKRLGNFFLRVYLGTFGALVGTLLLSVLLVNLANQVRQEAFHEAQLSGLFNTLTEEFSRLTPGHEAEWLNDINQTLGIQVNQLHLSNENFNRRESNRLKERRLLLRPGADGSLEVFFPTDTETLLSTQLWRVTEQQASASIYLLLRELQRTPTELRDARLRQLNEHFAYPLELLTQLPVETDQLQQRRLERGEQVVLFSDAPRHLLSYIQLGDNSWLRVGPVDLFNPYPLPLLMAILLLSLLMLAVSIWWFLRGLESRLRSLERASSQLAAGNLQARVPLSGKDFVSKLAITFNRMAEQVQRLLRTQQEMIHAVSHELRTPVARIRFGLQMIEDLSEDGSPHEAIVYQVQGIDRDIDELDTLIDEILTYARLGQEKLQLQFMTQDVSGLLEEVLSGFQRTHPSLKLSLQIENPANFSPEADLEGRYFQRAIQNLVGNAVRYAHQQIRITCYLESDTFRVDVEDDGPGIPEEDWQRVFMPFSRLDDSRTRSSGGYGLGLSIVQRIIYWHRGSALVDRSPDLQGARFSLIFPRQQSSDLPPLEIPPQ